MRILGSSFRRLSLNPFSPYGARVPPQVFGGKPPIETVFILAQDLYRIVVEALEDGGGAPPCPARVLLQEFLFTRTD